MDHGRYTMDDGRPLVSTIVLTLVFLLFLLPVEVSAQSLPSAGETGTFDVATWNIEWFGDENNGTAFDSLQFVYVRAIIEQSEIDLWALQEIADPDDFYRLIDSLGASFGGSLGGPVPYGGGQRLAYIYRTGVVDIDVSGPFFGTDYDGYEFGYRPPFEVSVTVTLSNYSENVTVVTFHAKAFDDEKSYERRKDGAEKLYYRIKHLRPDDPIIILGDFNDELDSSIRFGEVSPYRIFIDDPANFLVTTLHFEEGNELHTFCENPSCTDGSTLDHIILTNELAPSFVSSARYTAVLDAFNRYTYEVSDHLPVYAQLDFALLSSTEPAEALPEKLTVSAPSPNPFTVSTTLQYRLPHPTDVRIEVYDVLGRQIAKPLDAFQTAGEHDFIFSSEGLAAGLYFIRIEAAGNAITQSVAHH